MAREDEIEQMPIEDQVNLVKQLLPFVIPKVTETTVEEPPLRPTVVFDQQIPRPDSLPIKSLK